MPCEISIPVQSHRLGTPRDRRAQLAPEPPQTDVLLVCSGLGYRWNCNLEGVLSWQSKEEVSVIDKTVSVPWALTDIINAANRV